VVVFSLPWLQAASVTIESRLAMVLYMDIDIARGAHRIKSADWQTFHSNFGEILRRVFDAPNSQSATPRSLQPRA
jgi:hypothetical protein